MTKNDLPKDDPDLRIREELISTAALNPFSMCSSSPRLIMMSSHIAQMVTIEHGEPSIIQTGLERQLSESTVMCKLEDDARILAFLRRYCDISANGVQSESEYMIITQNIEDNRLDAITVPKYNKNHKEFGFEYVKNDDTLNPIHLNSVLPKDTVFAKSPTIGSSGEYKFGYPANIAYLHIPEVTGDGVVISKSLAKKYSFKTYETIVVEFGEKSFPLNLYGDDDNYKIFPDIGEIINPDRVVMATRDYDSELAGVLVSKSGVRDYSVYFDKPFYSKSPGGEVIDIKVYTNNKHKRALYSHTTDQVDRYSIALKRYYESVINVYETQNRQHYAAYKENIPVTPRMHRLLVDAYAITETKRNVRFTHKNDLVDIYRVEITISHSCNIDELGFKVTTLSGSKGVVVKILEDSEMPVDANGVVADLIMDPTSIPGSRGT